MQPLDPPPPDPPTPSPSPLRLLTAIDVGYPIVGGAQITHQTFLRQLAERAGHTCAYLDRAQTARRARGGAPRQDSFRDLAELRRKVEAWRPDAMIAAFTLIPDAVKLGRHLGVPVLAYLNSFEYCPPAPDEAAAWQLSLRHAYPSPEARAFALAEADAVVVNSDFLRRRLLDQTGCAAQVIHPPFDPMAIQAIERRRGRGRAARADAIVGVCGHPHKGAAVFLDLARRFPRERFVVAGALHADWAAAFEAAPNLSHLPFAPLVRLLGEAKLVLVPSQWPEPFGRIAVEAMAAGIPTLVSMTGGLMEIAGDGPLGVVDFRDPAAWAERLAALLASTSASRDQVDEGRARSARFLSGESSSALEALLCGLANRPRRPRDRRAVVVLAGQADPTTAFAAINARWAAGLQEAGRQTVRAAPALHTTTTPTDFVPTIIDALIHHDYSQDFKAVELPGEGLFIAVRTWDFGPFPPAWVRRINADCDQLWVYSRWTRALAIAGGVAPGGVRVIPPGIDPTVFRPDGPARALGTDRRVRFLFAGATVLRKGADILLAAWREAFSSGDDVCLVIKDNPRDTFYHGVRLTDRIQALSADPAAAPVLLVDDFLDPPELAALYRACSVGVFPYRAEGFALPILEAMACGLPSIAPRFGACLDYCAERTSFLVPTRRIQIPVAGDFAFNTLGFSETIEAVDFCEVPVPVLAEALRRISALPAAELAARGTAGVAVAHGRFTWSHSTARILHALGQAQATRTPRRLRRARADALRRRRVFETAKALYLGVSADEARGRPSHSAP